MALILNVIKHRVGGNYFLLPLKLNYIIMYTKLFSGFVKGNKMFCSGL